MNIKIKTKNTDLLFEKLYLFFFVLLPFTYSDKIVDPVLLPRQILLSIFVILLSSIIIVHIKRKKITPDFSFLKLPIFIVFTGLIITIVISFFQSIVIQESVYVFSKVALEFLFFVLTTFLIIQEKLTIGALVKHVAIFSGISLFLSLYQLTELAVSNKDFLAEVTNISSTYGIKNLLSSILFLTFPFLLNAFQLSKSWRVISIVIITLSVCLIWLLQTKAVIVATLVFSAVILFFSLKYKITELKTPTVKALATIGISITIIAIVISIQNRQKFSHLFDKKSSIERLFIWENSVQMIKEYPILGVGAGNWQIHVPKYGLNKCPTTEIKMGIRTLQRPHNDFLWVFCETGILGITLYIGIFSIVLYYAFKLFQNQWLEASRWLFLTLFAIIISYILIAFVDFPFERIEHQVLLLVAFSIISANYYSNIHDAKNKSITLKTSTINIFIISPALFSLLVSSKRLVGEFHSRKVYVNQNIPNWPNMIKETDKAMNAFYVIDPMSAPIQWYKGVALFSVEKANEAKTSFELAYAIHPYNIHVINNLASCYESLNNHNKAIELYNKALSISSEFDEVRLNLSAVYYNTKNYNKAFEIIDLCKVDCTDPKYKIFLPAILITWLEQKLKEEMVSNVKISRLLTNKEEILKLYYESKTKNIKFDRHVLNQCNTLMQ